MKRKLFILTLLIGLFSISSIFSQFNPQPNWKDSYRVVDNGKEYCFCTTNGNGSYDHGIANKTVEINGTPYTVRNICEELKKHPRYRAFRNGDIPYNTIQCGNRPYNDAPDEPGCPGRVDQGPSGCDKIGPKWDMAWLRTRTVFNGTGGDTGGGNDGNADEGTIGTAGTGGNGAGQGPKLSVIFPTLNKRIQAPATIRVEAEATDQDGVRDVEVKINGIVVSKKTAAPYIWNNNGQVGLLSNLPEQNYLIEVKAVDKKGNSSIVDILVYVTPATPANESLSLTAISTQKPGKAFTFPVVYSAKQSRDIVIEIRNPANKWLGQGKIKVQAGSGTAQVAINLPQVAPNGTPYKATAQLRPVGASWQQNIKSSAQLFTIDGTTGGGGTDGGGTDGGGNNDGVTIKGQSINKYVSSEGGSRSMRANRTTVGAGEKFTVKSEGNGTVSLKGSNGKYVSSENGGKAMTCNRSAVGSWEKFTLESLGGDLYAIKGNNGKYVSHENGKDKGMFCNRNAIGSWEKFIIKGLNGSRTLATQNNKSIAVQSVSVYPNPIIKGEDIRIQVTTPKEVLSYLEIMDLTGRAIVRQDLGLLKAGTKSIAIGKLQNKINKAGLYLVKVKLGKKTIVKQMMVE